MTLFELPIDLSSAGPADTTRLLHRQIRDGIVAGRLKPGSRLPPSRSAALLFGVSRNTVADVYARLISEGFATARQGAGTYVADPIPVPGRPASSAPHKGTDPRLNGLWLQPEVTDAIGFWNDGGGLKRPTAAIVADFRPAMVDARFFPFDQLRRCMAAQLRRMETAPSGFRSPQGNQGNYHLRTNISEHIGYTRAVACRPEDLVVTSGAQQAFDLLARTLVHPGRTVVAVEDPGYPPMRAVFAAAGARVVPIEVDGEGMVVGSIPENANIICVCPSHQFPLGVSMSARRRAELIDFARTRHAVIIEDDYDGEFRHDGASLAALHSPASADIVFYVGTFSKCMLPSLRLGFMIAPAWAMRALISAKNCVDWHSSIPMQLAVARFMADGMLAKHVARMRRLYASRKMLLSSALSNALSPRLELVPSSYGLHVAALSVAGVDVESACRAGEKQGIRVHSLRRYHFGQERYQGLVLGFGVADERAIERGVDVLASLLRF